MTGTRTTHATLASAMAEPVWPVTARVVDVTNAEQFPNIAAAVNYTASLSQERRASLYAEWEN